MGVRYAVLPLQKGPGGGRGFSYAEGDTNSFEVVLTWELEVSAIQKVFSL